MKKIYLIIFINLLFLATQYGLTNHFSTIGIQVSTMQDRIRLLSHQNSALINQTDLLSSLDSIYAQAQILQLTPLRVDFVTLPGLAALSH